MSEKKYTPGPWIAVDSRSDSYGPVKDCPIWIDGDGWILASIVGDVECIDAQANARLIACAPELLEALESLMAVRVIEADVTYGMVWNKAQQVVTKAKGETE